MAKQLKLVGSEVALSNTASNLALQKVIRVYNGNAADQLVTVKNGSDTVGTITVKTKTDVILEKNTEHTLEVGSGVANVKAVAIAYTN
tara:strand:+ start:128 stop:391 length:264 start_codon:yes stop_codon:yes gene_type:complete